MKLFGLRIRLGIAAVALIGGFLSGGAAALVASVPASAADCAAGSVCTLDNFASSDTGIVDIGTDFVSGIAACPNLAINRTSSGTLDFLFQPCDDQSSANVTQVVMHGFAGVTTNVGYIADSNGGDGIDGIFTGGSVAPTAASRTSGGDIDWTVNLSPNQYGDILVIKTNTTAADLGLNATVDFSTGSPEEELAFEPDTDLSLTNVPPNQIVNATGPNGAVVNYTPPTVSDPDDVFTSSQTALASTATCSPPPGTFAIGTTTVTCSVSDGEGDPPGTYVSASASFTVTVVGGAGQLTALQRSVVGVGPGVSFVEKLIQAEGYLAANDPKDTCSTLTAFINEVTAALSKKAAVPYVAAATEIKAVLGC